MKITFDSQPIIYNGLIDLLLLIYTISLIYLIFQNKNELISKYRWVYFVGLILITFFFRLPSICYNTVLNPDESWLITGAMTLAENPFFWESVEGDTSGPINFYVITFFNKIFNQPFDFISARILAFILLGLSLFYVFKAINYFYNAPISLIAITPIAFYFGNNGFKEFLYYSSEYVSILLISIILYYISLNFKNQKPKNDYQFFIGFLGVITPFAKLQSIPITFICCFSSFFYVIFYTNLKSKEKTKSILWLFFGAILGLITVFIILNSIGVTDNAIEHYFIHNLSYSQTGKKFFDFNNLFNSFFTNHTEILRVILITSMILIVIKVIKSRKYFDFKFLFTFLFVIFSIFSAFKTGYLFHHYLLFLFVPTIFLVAITLSELNHYSIIYKYSVIFLLILIGYYNLINPMSNQFISTETTSRPLHQSNVAKKIIEITKPNDGIAILGGASHLYLESTRIQGVRFAHTLWGLYSQNIIDYKFSLYVNDLEKNKVPLFIDSHPDSDIFLNRKKAGYETIPILKKYINEKYILKEEIDGMRLFVRK